jgi:uroporphyrinogen decarboxylase
MNPKELFESTLKGDSVDRVPVFFLGGGWVGKFSGLAAERLFNESEALATAHLKAYEALEQDAIVCYFDPLFVPEVYGARVRALPTGPIVDPIPTGPGGIEHLKPVDVSEGRIPVILEALQRLARYSAGRVPVGTLCEGPFTTLGRILDAEVLLRMTIKNARNLRVLVGEVTDFLLRFGRAVAEAGADFLVVADPTASTTMISPRMYREFVFPFVERLIRGLAIPVVLHMCGDTLAILPLVSQTGVQVMNVDQCMNLAAARSQVSRTCTLAGNIDPVQSLLLGTVAEVAENTRQCLQQGGTTRFILMPGCGVPPDTPLENLGIMVQTAKGLA